MLFASSSNFFFKAVLTLLIGVPCTFAFADIPSGDLTTTELNQAYLSAVKATHEDDLPAVKLISLQEGQVAEMLTWTAHIYTPGSQVLSHEVWVVEAAEMKTHCAEILRQADKIHKTNPDLPALALEVNEWLGMPPDQNQTSSFVLIKVPVGGYLFTQKSNQSDASNLSAEIIRPCFISGDVSTQSCTYPDSKIFSKGNFVSSNAVSSASTALSPYQNWVENIKAETGDYPWTGLGYTYDWSPDSLSHIGLSEFILPVGAQVEVEKSVSVQEFCG